MNLSNSLKEVLKSIDLLGKRKRREQILINHSKGFVNSRASLKDPLRGLRGNLRRIKKIMFFLMNPCLVGLYDDHITHA